VGRVVDDRTKELLASLPAFPDIGPHPWRRAESMFPADEETEAHSAILVSEGAA
jgi:hypothetical protein